MRLVANSTKLAVIDIALRKGQHEVGCGRRSGVHRETLEAMPGIPSNWDIAVDFELDTRNLAGTCAQTDY